jgi:hypothetical protein
MLAASWLRARAEPLAATPLGESAGEVLSDALTLLEARVRGARRSVSSLARPGTSFELNPADPAGSRVHHLERVREVLERDRALVSAEPVEVPECRPEPAPEPAVAKPVCSEPIRTRTLARLLASQGYEERALSIYEYLLAQPGSDAGLLAEASALRAKVEQQPPATGS